MPRKKSARTARNSATYGDHLFPGNGTLKCHLCSTPLRDHPIAQECPYEFNPLNAPTSQKAGRPNPNNRY